jgi:pilus assembly protein CpaD
MTRKPMRPILSMLTPALLALTLAACQAPFNGANDAWSAQGNQPITVDTHIVSQQFPITASSFELTQDQRDRLKGLVADYLGRGLGKLTITSPVGTPNSGAGLQVAAEMTQIANAAGVAPRRVDVAGYHATTAKGGAPVVVSYTVYGATPSPCGDWSTNYAYEPNNLMTPNHGCATQNNLAAELEDPRDLIAPRQQTAPDEARRATVFDKYRQGEPTGATGDKQDSGTVSEMK